MGFAFKFFMSLGATLAKWALVGVLWLGSVMLVTSSALVMDAISDGMSRMLSIQTPYARQKVEVARQQTKLAAQRQAVRKNSVKVQSRLRTMVKRNVADAATSIVPLIGGAASVGFAVTDVYAACDMARLQNDLDKAFDLTEDEDKSVFGETCAVALETVEGTKTKAESQLKSLQQKGTSLADSLGDLWGEVVQQGADYIELSSQYLKGKSGAQDTDVRMSDRNARWWICQGVNDEWGLEDKELPPFVLESDPATLLDLKTVAGAMGKDFDDMPFLNCTHTPTPDFDQSDRRVLARAKPTDIRCSTSGRNPITGQTGVRSHNTNLSFSTQYGWGEIEYQHIFFWSQNFQCTEGR